MNLLYKDLTYQIRSCIYEVAKEIGVGFDEETYHQALILSFLNRKVPFISKEKRPLFHRGVLIKNFINDFLVFDKIIVSLKSIQNAFIRAHYIQLFSELKLWQKELGLLVNFGFSEVNIQRYIFTEKEPIFEENFQYIANRISSTELQIINEVSESAKYVASIHKPGYGKAIWRKIIETELEHRKFSLKTRTLLPVHFAGKLIKTARLKHVLIENQILLAITALQKGVEQLDIASMQSYLKALDINTGIVVNFGKASVQITGVRRPK